MPPEVRHRLQQSAAALRRDEACAPFTAPPDAWGFCSAAQPAALQQGAAARGAWAAQLEQSQAFHAPDCVERMARVYGVTPHATLVSPPQCAAVAANVAALASALKGETQRAWAAEAVRRGVAHAKSGDLEAALRCYAQALELDAAHRDAHVARGAALANCGRLREGREACEAALLLDPSDRNARQYLDAIAAKLAAQAAEPEPEPAPAAHREQAAEALGQRRAEEASAPPPAAAAGVHARAIEPPGPMAPPAAATRPAGKVEPPVAAALHDALRAAADKLRHKHKRKRKHDSSAKKSKKHKKGKKKRSKSSSRSSSSSSSSGSDASAR